MVDIVRKRVRERPVDKVLDDIVELLNREHTPLILELRTRVNELIEALNPGAVVATAGASTAFLNVTIDGTDYSIELRARS